MAYIDDVLDAVAATLVTAFAPYQPNLLPDYPNTDPRAGTIPPTLCTAGHPIQNKVMKRLENKMTHVGVYDQAPERVRPFVSTDIPTLTDGSGDIFYELGRTQKKIIAEVWAFDRTSRRNIQNIVRQTLGDVYTQVMADGTYTKLFYVDTIPFDDEQKDTLYIGQIHYMADFVVLGETTGAPAATITTGLTTEDCLGTAIGSVVTITTT